jgi:hypothetical protein
VSDAPDLRDPVEQFNDLPKPAPLPPAAAEKPCCMCAALRLIIQDQAEKLAAIRQDVAGVKTSAGLLHERMTRILGAK